jgi:TRAP transporter 4TM/12TM fusion protein
VFEPAAIPELAGQRAVSGAARGLVQIVAVALPVLTLAVALTGWLDPMTRRAGHLLLAIPLVFFLYPASRGGAARLGPLDALLAAASVLAFGWVVVEAERIRWRLVYVDPVEPVDLVLGVAALLLVLEATRRTLGWTLVVVTAAFVAYAFAGPWLPGLLAHKGVALPLLVEHLYLVPEGLFNQITGIMATYLMVFLTFGTTLRLAGADRLFFGLSFALTGRSAGGPAKAAVVGSSLMGMLSGSTIANVVTTGTVTIPLMKRCGYRPHEAAAIETAAGTGGALVPPIMGAGVFVMAELTGIPLITILKYSVVPALVYYGALFAYVHIKARKSALYGIEGEPAPPLGQVLARGGHLFAPLALLVYLLWLNYSPFLSGAMAVLALIAVSWLRAETRLTPRRLVFALEASTRGALLLSATSASAAVITGVINVTGLLLKVTSLLMGLSGGSLLIGLGLVAAVCSIIGMGLPITSTYIIVSALGAAALVELGASLLAAHLVIFWFSQTATVTPPVCMTAFVAAQIAGARPMRTGVEAMRVAKALYLVPLLLVFTHLLSPDPWRVVFDGTAGLFAVVLVTVVAEGWWAGPLSAPARVLAGGASASLFAAAFHGSLVSTLGWLAVGLVLAVAARLWHRPGDGNAAAVVAPEAAP